MITFLAPDTELAQAGQLKRGNQTIAPFLLSFSFPVLLARLGNNQREAEV
jgi:hypothetical protein